MNQPQTPIDYRKGFRRLWLISLIVWYLYAAAVYAFQVSEWVGFHYSLLKDSESFTLAMEKKQKVSAVIAACHAAREAACWVPSDRPDTLFPGVEFLPNCEQTRAFNDTFIREANARGIDVVPTGKNGEACPDLIAMGIPYVDWAEFFGIALAPFGLIVIYLTGRWIIKGFIRQVS